ncbi:MAG TPA: biotin--[acetyl-CoA-carboxylase] ligase [Candidatus Limnocylindria bacterium]|nr:biotin--[acetyl-CoA-carboxylase] ligase [Candidatus Limnocylindria bacterium]
MTDASAWSRAAVSGRRVGHTVEHHGSLGSTNDRAREALAEPGGEGRAVVADHQSAGRGRRGRQWLSPPGHNLMVSVALRPRIEPARAGLLGIAAAVATRDACEAAVPRAGLLLRWPNDVVTGDGLKVAGLLVDTALADDRLADAVVGIGINVNWRRAEMPAEIVERATSLADLAGPELDRVALLATLLDALDREVVALESGASPVARFAEVSALDGRQVEVQVGEERLEGMAAGVAEDGALLLDVPAGRLALTVGEVVAVRDPAGAAA